MVVKALTDEYAGTLVELIAHSQASSFKAIVSSSRRATTATLVEDPERNEFDVGGNLLVIFSGEGFWVLSWLFRPEAYGLAGFPELQSTKHTR